MVTKIQKNRLKQKFIKINTKEGSGTIKIFGDELNPFIPYKTFLLSIKDTAEWIVREMLEKYGLKHENLKNYCLLQIVIPSHNQMNNKLIKEAILHNNECPLNIYLNHIQKKQESIIYKVIKCPLEYIEIKKNVRVQESSSDIIQDRMINTRFPIFVEANIDGTDLAAPRVFRLHPNITYVGRDTKTKIGKQYFYIDGIGIDRNHCIIQNQNNNITLIPRGKVKLNGKNQSKSFNLQHGALICFGRNSTFRYYDPQFIEKINSLSIQTNQDKLTIYNSLPIDLNKTNNIESRIIHIQQKKIPSIDVINTEKKINVLPGLLEVPVETEIQFLYAVFYNYPLNNIHFRLSPAYTLYMALRHRFSSSDKINIPFIQKQNDIISFLCRIEDMINKKIEECQNHAGYLAYWLSNTSEFVYFLKKDQDLLKISYNIQICLINHIQRTFYYLINIFQNELNKYLIVFINTQDNIEQNNLNQSEIRWIILEKTSNKYQQLIFNDILALLSSIIDLFCKCRVNASLTIQIFSQIFRYINTWLFNRIVCHSELKLCSYIWGEKLLYRLKTLNDWAQKQGLEIASERYLTKVNQLCLLLQNPKHDIRDVQQLILNNTFQINSIQVTQILNNYILDRNELPITNDFRQALLSIAYKHVDEHLHREGFIIQLAEESNLNLSFLLPEDGYTCENLRYIPQPLFEFIESISRSKLCHLFINPYSLGMWTEFMLISNIENNNQIETIILNKKENNLGLSIVSAKNEFQQFYGIYIKGIIPGSAAEDDRRLQPGDQILSVDNISLNNMTQEEAVQVLKQCGSSVILKILKNAANLHGLSILLPTSSENYHELVHSSSISNSSSKITLQTTTNNEKLSTNEQQHNLYNSSIIQPSYSNEILVNKQINHYISNPNIFHLKQTYKQQFDNNKNNFIRTQSFTKPLISREDIPSDYNENYHIKSTIPPKTLPKPTINTITLMRQSNSTNNVDISNRLSKANLSSSSDHLTSLRNNLKLENKFDHHYQNQINDNNNQKISHLSLNATDNIDEFDERLKRRLEQFEEERNIERAYINQMFTKRQADIEEQVRKNREREIRVNRDMQEFKIRRMSEEDQILEAKKEEARLLKHILNKSK